MTSEWEARERAKSDQRRLALLMAVDFKLEEEVQALGGYLTGFSVSIRPQDCLMTLRANFEEKPMVAFVGSDGLGNLFVKATTEAGCNKLTWREDKFGKQQS